LIVLHKSSGKLAGTYRILPGTAAVHGFYSETEFEISGLEKIIQEAAELGRSCVAPEFRFGTVIALLWQGLAEIIRRGGFRYIFGCVSISPPDPEKVWSLYEYICRPAEDNSILSARPRCRVPHPTVLCRRQGSELRHIMPPLMHAYLRLGGTFCGEPAFDAELDTADLLMLLDLKRLPLRYRHHFRLSSLIFA
jgi:putative hemolysin